MGRESKTVDYERSGQQTLTTDQYLPGEHLARFIVAIVEMLDLKFSVLSLRRWVLSRLIRR